MVGETVAVSDHAIRREHMKTKKKDAPWELVLEPFGCHEGQRRFALSTQTRDGFHAMAFVEIVHAHPTFRHFFQLGWSVAELRAHEVGSEVALSIRPIFDDG